MTCETHSHVSDVKLKKSQFRAHSQRWELGGPYRIYTMSGSSTLNEWDAMAYPRVNQSLYARAGCIRA